jgi:antitoxin (DNA-binding transcriptional repressor) of toxin-antitoxin stability system
MTTMTAKCLTRRPADVRRAVREGEEVRLTFHGTTFARVIDDAVVTREREELARLRAENHALRERLAGAAAPAPHQPSDH